MHPGVITCLPDASLGMVAVLLNNHRIHAIAVADAAGRILGIVSDFDLLACEWLSTDENRRNAMRAMTARDLMTSPVDTVRADAAADKAAQKILETGISRLLVTDEGKSVGVISVADFVAAVADLAPVGGKTVADVMSDAILVCRDKTPVVSAARAMMSTGWRAVIIVNERGKPLGTVTGMEVLGIFDQKNGTKEPIVTDIMKPALTIHMDADLRGAASKMIENHNHRLIVVDPKNPDAMPLGIISSYDIVANMARPGSGWR
jgi:predicted transcriptional regulator